MCVYVLACICLYLNVCLRRHTYVRACLGKYIFESIISDRDACNECIPQTDGRQL